MHETVGGFVATRSICAGHSAPDGSAGHVSLAHHTDGDAYARAHRPSADSFQGSCTGAEDCRWKIEDQSSIVHHRLSSYDHRLRNSQTVGPYVSLAPVHPDAGVDE